MTPNQAVFNQMYIICQSAGPTYDYLPGGSTKYPFIFVGESFNIETTNNDLIGTVRQTVHLYGKRTDRMALDNMMVQIHDQLKEVNQFQGYSIRLRDFNAMVVPDNTDVQPLLHYILENTLIYNKER